MTHTTNRATPGDGNAGLTTYTALLRLPEYLRQDAGEDEQTDFAVKVRAASSQGVGYLLWHFDTDYPDRAAAQAAADTVECIGLTEGEITFIADRPITLTDTSI